MSEATPIGGPQDERPGVGGGGAPSAMSQILAELDDPHRARGAIRQLQTAVKNGWIEPWQIEARAAVAVPKRMLEIVDRPGSENDRAATAAAGALGDMRAFNLRMAETVDKAQRLDAGDPTDIGLQIVIEEDRGPVV